MSLHLDVKLATTWLTRAPAQNSFEPRPCRLTSRPQFGKEAIGDLRSASTPAAKVSSPLFIRLQVEKALRQSSLAELFGDGPLFDDAAAVVDRKERKEQEKQKRAKQEKKLRHQGSKRRRLLVALAANRRLAQQQSVLPTTLPDVGPGSATATSTATEMADQQWQENLNLTMTCPECKEFPPNLVEEFSSGDMVCGSCGLVLGDRIVDTRSEWRTFSNDEQGNDDPSRVGDAANPLLNGSQLQTTIAYSDGGSGRARDLHRAQSKATHDKSTKTLLAAYKEIGAFCDAIGIPKNVSDTAKHLFKMVDDAKAFKGKPQDVLSAGCIFIACRQCNVPRTFTEVFAVTKVSKKEIGRIFKSLEKFFALQNREKEEKKVLSGGYVNPQEAYVATKSTHPQQLCIRFCSHLGLDAACTKVSQELAKRMSLVGALAGRSPLSGAAACIYMASHLMKQAKTAKEISGVVGVSDATIRTAYKFLYRQRHRLIDEEWYKDGKGDIGALPST
ncbi:MAG: transcription initiation factor IIB [Phylliscum demangeonii]|nr:MAG: transcription initiation factor IIB [Phylliscum demangeonii]